MISDNQKAAQWLEKLGGDQSNCQPAGEYQSRLVIIGTGSWRA
jgi:hypothetical protein